MLDALNNAQSCTSNCRPLLVRELHALAHFNACALSLFPTKPRSPIKADRFAGSLSLLLLALLLLLLLAALSLTLFHSDRRTPRSLCTALAVAVALSLTSHSLTASKVKNQERQSETTHKHRFLLAFVSLSHSVLAGQSKPAEARVGKTRFNAVRACACVREIRN